jgi:diguanylate cyclase (GGDEF)-like protein
MEERLEAVCGAARRHGFAVSVLLLDLDHFKAVNDQHGHAAGDAVLRAAGAVLKGHMRGEDLAGRWGGEEFVVLSPYVDHNGALSLAERLRSSLASEPVDLGHGTTVVMTASVGVCTDCGDHVEPASLLAAADWALYEAKASGRNRVVSATC